MDDPTVVLGILVVSWAVALGVCLVAAASW